MTPEHVPALLLADLRARGIAVDLMPWDGRWRATFEHDGQTWVAVRADAVAAIGAALLEAGVRLE